MNKVIAIIIVLSVLALGGLGVGAWYLMGDSGPNITYRTGQAKKGDLLATISATGTVEPEEVVDVGAQVAGLITEFGKDKSGKVIDYGSEIVKGAPLAKIEDTLYAADKASADAQLAQAKANVKKARADLLQMKAKLIQAENDWNRAQKLGTGNGALAETQYDAYKAAFETAKANVQVAEAVIVQTDAAVDAAEATVKRANRNLSLTTISSPVDGVVIDRRVNIGQTVVASLNAPSLFLIAKDLKRMEVWVAVNEADIGNIREGQPVTFTCDAFVGQTFRGKVGKVRLNATMTQNVVTYTVEVEADNSNGKLLPYLTANVSFEIARRHDVMLVPNAALRYIPTVAQVAPEFRATADAGKGGGGSGGSDGGGSGRGGAKRAASADDTGPATRPTSRPAGAGPQNRGTIFVKQGKFLKPIQVRTGYSDGTNTEVISTDGQVTDGMEVVIGEQRAGTAAKAAGNTNPFTPQIGGRKGR